MRGTFANVAAKATQQHGRVTWEQLVDEGIHRHTIQRWIEDGRLHPVHKGIYAVGHPGRSMLADYMAAVLACGTGGGAQPLGGSARDAPPAGPTAHRHRR